ncbi:MAG: carbonic anhydrase family protein [Fidelibacterota bacterium]|nr:MAG: carbonic anhydrase family protein [Candidatus Neomarinimicrobiota bacterium]
MSSAQHKGTSQSPIDLTQVAGSSSLNVTFHYTPTPLQLINTGHTVQVNPQVENYMTIDNRRYELKQFHFHAPSEHLVNGEQCDLEAHLVHEGPDGELAVVGLFYRLGAENDLISVLWERIPSEPGSEQIYPEAVIDPRIMITPAGQFYTYDGSLTTPPYTEGVKWVLLQSPLTVSSNQLEVFIERFGENARPVQPLHGRVVLEGSLSAP